MLVWLRYHLLNLFAFFLCVLEKSKLVPTKYFSIFVSSLIGKFVLIGFTWSFCYHLLNGIRHLFWDLGYGYELKTANLSGTLVLLSSFLVTLALWILA